MYKKHKNSYVNFNGAYFLYDDKYNSVEKDGEEDGYEHRNG